MQFQKDVRLIQGGMGVYVSNWRLARAVSMERPAITAGTVSGTALDLVYVRLLQLGDPGGHVRRALEAFDVQFGIDIGQKIIQRYFIQGGKSPSTPYKVAPKQAVHAGDGSDIIPPTGDQSHPIALTTDEEFIELVIAANFAEVWLAKEGHEGKIFINYLKKVELPLLYGIYGAMLAGVDAIVVGAGNPDGLPMVCSRLANHETVSIELPVLYRQSGVDFHLSFDPRSVAGGRLVDKPLQRPAFLAIVSLHNLVIALAGSQSGAPDGFIIEHHTAGGHNAAPQGPLKKDERGQPIYSHLDEPDLDSIRQVGLPFWLAGGYGSHEKLQQALDAGAVGVQAGTIFALAEESGMKATYRSAIFSELKNSIDDAALVQTTLFSPTGFPFKVVQLAGTLSDDAVYSARRRICDLGYLLQRGLSKPAADGSQRLFQRCPAAPVEDFVRKRGLPINAQDKRCLCNGLLACVGLAQLTRRNEVEDEEPAIVTLGNCLDGVRRLSSHGQRPYWARDAVNDILGGLILDQPASNL